LSWLCAFERVVGQSAERGGSELMGRVGRLRDVAEVDRRVSNRPLAARSVGGAIESVLNP
jgi:hypothetical protein